MNLGLIINLAGVIVAILVLLFQIQRSAFSMSVDLTLKLDDRFNSDSFRKLRIISAKGILRKEFHEAEEVFDFFETLGLLIRRGALDKEMVWSTFFYWIHRYWLASSDYILNAQKDDPSLWSDFKLLHEEVVQVEKKKRKITDSDLFVTGEKIREFLKEELSNQ